MLRTGKGRPGAGSRAGAMVQGERFRPWRSAAAHYLWAETDA